MTDEQIWIALAWLFGLLIIQIYRHCFHSKIAKEIDRDLDETEKDTYHE